MVKESIIQFGLLALFFRLKDVIIWVVCHHFFCFAFKKIERVCIPLFLLRRTEIKYRIISFTNDK